MASYSEVPRHPIRVAAERAGLTPATLRAWERRYGAVRPERSAAGQRLYSDRDVHRLRTMHALVDAGRPIRMVARLADAELEEMLEEDRKARAAAAPAPTAASPEPDGGGTLTARVLREAMVHVRAMDPDALEWTLRRGTAGLGGAAFLENVAAPLLVRIGAAWAEGALDPAQEHLASAVVERVVATLIQPPLPGSPAPRLVVGTPAGERHGLGALFVAATASLEGWDVIYLGVDLPAGSLAAAAVQVGATAVALSVVRPDGETPGHVRELRETLPDAMPLLIGGRGTALLSGETLPADVRVVANLGDLRATLRSLGAEVGAAPAG